MSNQNGLSKLHATLELYRHAEERRGLQISRIWETIKLVTTIVFALFTATVVLLEYFKSPVVVVLPFFAIAIVGWSFVNVRREYRRFLEIVTWILKVERYLGLHEWITEVEKRHFVDEGHLVPERFIETRKFRTGEEFVKAKLTIFGYSMYRHFALLSILYSSVAIGLVAIVMLRIFIG